MDTLSERMKLSWWKFLATWACFLLLHFSYEAFPNRLFQVIGEEGETTYFHMKMLFFAYLITSLIEFLIRRPMLESVETFFYGRAFIAVAYPWLTITIWFTAEALGLRLPLFPWELIYANGLTALGIYLALRMEELFEGINLRPALQVMILLLFGAALLSYVAFSFDTPLHFFTTPSE
jgi:hypothetical protein